MTDRKKLLLGVSFIGGLIIIASLAAWLTSSPKNSPSQPATSITPVQVTTSVTPLSPTRGPLQVQSVSPLAGATNVPLDSKLAISFNQPFSMKDILFSLSPNISYNLSIAGTSLIISPTNLLTANTPYTFSVSIDGEAQQSFSFTTTQVVITSQDSVPGASDQLNKDKYPDIFLYNRMPFSSDGFQATGGFTSSPSEHYYFTVSLTNADGKTAFINWMKSLGLSDQQIQQLDIRYQ